MDEVFADEQVQHLDMVALDVIRNPCSMDGISDSADHGRRRFDLGRGGAGTVDVIDTGTEQLLCDVDDGIALVTFNNPTKRNALSAPIRGALPGVLRTLQANDDVRVVVLTGAGGKAFVSGADISEFGDAAHDA